MGERRALVVMTRVPETRQDENAHDARSDAEPMRRIPRVHAARHLRDVRCPSQNAASRCSSPSRLKGRGKRWAPTSTWKRAISRNGGRRWGSVSATRSGRFSPEGAPASRSSAPTRPRSGSGTLSARLTRSIAATWRWGRADDGGYYLIAMSALHPEAFALDSFGHEGVFAETVSCLERAGLVFESLRCVADIDPAS